MSTAVALENPAAWPVLLGAVCGAWALRALERRRERRLAALLGARAASLGSDLNPRARRLRARMAAGALLVGGAALLQPAWGEGEAAPDGGPADLMICLDVSRSMLARDAAPDRLRRAHEEIRALARRARGDRLGLVAFAGEARLLIPLTEDVESFVLLLELAVPGVLPRGGSDLGAALDTALRALGPATGEHEAIVLMTDGEDLAAAGLAAARRVRERGIPLHCVGFGSPEGGKIPVPDGNGERFLRDAAGREVVSALDAEGLRAIASATGGAYLEAGREPGALERLHRERLAPLAGRAAGVGAERPRAPRFRWFLLAAFALGLLECAWSERARR